MSIIGIDMVYLIHHKLSNEYYGIDDAYRYGDTMAHVLKEADGHGSDEFEKTQSYPGHWFDFCV